ncbi:transmembrane protein EpsG [Chryseobacterium bernardetii]|uniref:Transmembrane protein EpsG n=3 Tax=Chryseobacterium TaxID=59732 RepID=A0ACC6IZ84_9FLAO|nr:MULTISPECIES: EpsG family protein [Chryseobacterium]MDR6372711.1 transmembrane protein EpsG [Chryseobacterium vietnamense]MDR6442929.1 transmembrane protein EpsG [Chryseobacterium bernardetii]MDR6460889.1 transmembrane protein EpsG [Chryseobacterium vietnamense]MDR6489734.1 transmembrane protein EpsG [Chryseobacterium vietnamense]
MSLLHPYYIIAIVYMLFFSVQEVYGKKVDKKWFWFLAIYFILIVGFRDSVGPDYGSYKGIYIYSDTKSYYSIFMKMLHMEGTETLDVEWLYTLINKVLLNFFDAPFYMLTLVIAIFAMIFKVEYTEDNTFYPFTFTLFMFIPNFFIGESGQIRQNLGTFIVYFAIRYIKERKLWHYLFFIFIGSGIHSVCYLFLPMYWLARVPLNRTVMLIMIVGSVFLSPFEIYRSFGGFLDGMASNSTLVEGFNGYMDETVQRLNGGIGIPEVMMAILTFFLFVFDNKMKELYPYYEYHRNYAVIGICLYFIFRNNPIFSSRLAGAFIGFSYIIIPNAMYVVSGRVKNMIYAFIIALVVFNFVVFSMFNNITAGRFSIDRYQNHVLP